MRPVWAATKLAGSSMLPERMEILMEEKNKKPDYTDVDWMALAAMKDAEWEQMRKECESLGWKTVDLRNTDGFMSKLTILPIQKEKRGMLIVCPGGGFMFKSANEAKPVAEYFHQAGFNAAILDYHVVPDGMTNPEVRVEAGEDGLMAVRYLRSHAQELGILEDHIAIGGFSAGGVLSGYAATKFDGGDSDQETPMLRVSSRPDAALILYGAISESGMEGNGLFVHDTKVQAKRCANDPLRNIRSDCPPMFVFHKDDPRHALLFCYQLASYGVPYEIHTFEDGPHRGGLYNGKDNTPDIPHTVRWAMLAAEWLEGKGF